MEHSARWDDREIRMQSMTIASTMGMTIGREKCHVRAREDELSRWETLVGGAPRRRFRTRGRGSSRADDMGTSAKASRSILPRRRMWPRWNCRSRAIRTTGVKSSGLDIDSETISFAQTAYPNVKFVAADIARAGELFPTQFDIIYAFNAFYAFPDQQAALGALRLAAKPEAILCLFDYLDRGGFTETPLRENLKRFSGIRFL